MRVHGATASHSALNARALSAPASPLDRVKLGPVGPLDAGSFPIACGEQAAPPLFGQRTFVPAAGYALRAGRSLWTAALLLPFRPHGQQLVESQGRESKVAERGVGNPGSVWASWWSAALCCPPACPCRLRRGYPCRW